MLRKICVIVMCLIVTSSAYAQESVRHGRLTVGDIERVKEFKQLTSDIDPKSVKQTIADLEKTPYPKLNLIIKETLEI